MPLGFPKESSDGDFASLPFDRVDAAFRFLKDGKAYIFSGEEYASYDLDRREMDPGSPARVGIDGWLGGPTGDFDAVFQHPTNGIVYFFKGVKYYRFIVSQDRFQSGSGRIGVDGWHGWQGWPKDWSDGVRYGSTTRGQRPCFNALSSTVPISSSTRPQSTSPDTAT